jgi:hypothetical protein
MERTEKLMQTTLAEPPLKEVSTETQQEFQRFYQENLGLIYRYVYSQVSNREEAEDLTSQIFIKVVTSIDYELNELSMKKWLFHIQLSLTTGEPTIVHQRDHLMKCSKLAGKVQLKKRL